MSAFAQPEAGRLRRFEIVRSPRNLAQPHFDVLAAALQARLVQAGYVPASAEEAEITIFVNYLSDDAWKLYPSSVPVDDMAFGESIHAQPSSLNPNSPPTVVTSVPPPVRPSTERQRIMFPPEAVAMVSLSIQAVPTAHYRSLAAMPRSEWKRHPAVAIWEVHAWHTGKSPSDLPATLQKMLGAVAPYFARSTRGTKAIAW